MDSVDSMESAMTQDETISLKELDCVSMKERIKSLVDTANRLNFRTVANQLLRENEVAGKGLLCLTIMKSQSESPESSDVLAAMVAIVNSKFPEVGYLLVKRVVLQFKAACDRGEKEQMDTASRFLAQLVNRRVVYEFLAMSVLMFLLVNPTPVNLEIAVSFCSQCGPLLHEVVPHKLKEILSEFRRLMKKRRLEKQLRVLISRLLLCAGRWKFKECALDAVDDEDQVTHDVTLLQDIDYETSLDRFNTNHNSEEDEEVSSTRLGL